MKHWALLRENFRISVISIRTNALRTILTILIIAIGITALVGILTAIDSLKSSISDTFKDMGANTFTIQSFGSNYQVLNKRVRKKSYSYISYRQAQEFKEKYSIPSNVAVETWITGTATVTANGLKTNPNIGLGGGDEGYLIANGVELDKGRMFSAFDMEIGNNVAVIGSELVKKLFPGKKSVLDEYISVNSVRYRVIGTFKTKGNDFGGGVDRWVIIPISNARANFSRPNQSFSINITPEDPTMMDDAIGEAESVFRQVRRLTPADESDFNIEQSDSIIELMLDMMNNVTIAAFVISAITLLGAAVGLMNIMLVAVTERTREIGTRKAMGATSKTIKQQFLFESIMIGQLGGLLGIVLGILVGNALPLFTGGSFTVPWVWMLLGVAVCFLVSVASGYIPAVRAARLDPIEALRYE